MRDILIGIDAGTSVIKSVAFDLRGRQIAMAALPNAYEAVGRAGSVQDLDRTWADAAATLKQLSDKIENLAGRVAAIAVTGQGDGTWMIDRDGAPVGKGWLWLDARAGETVERLRADSGDIARFQSTGVGLAACQQGPQLRWMRDHAPEMLNGVATTFHCKDWLYFRLTGKRATDPSEANFSFGNFRTRTYSDDVIAFLGRRYEPSGIDTVVERHFLQLHVRIVLGVACALVDDARQTHALMHLPTTDRGNLYALLRGDLRAKRQSAFGVQHVGDGIATFGMATNARSVLGGLE